MKKRHRQLLQFKIIIIITARGSTHACTVHNNVRRSLARVCVCVCMGAIHFQFHLLLARHSYAIPLLDSKQSTDTYTRASTHHTNTSMEACVRRLCVLHPIHVHCAAELKISIENVLFLFRFASLDALSFILFFSRRTISSSFPSYGRDDHLHCHLVIIIFLHNTNHSFKCLTILIMNGTDMCKTKLPALRNAIKCNWPIHRAFVWPFSLWKCSSQNNSQRIIYIVFRLPALRHNLCSWYFIFSSEFLCFSICRLRRSTEVHTKLCHESEFR